AAKPDGTEGSSSIGPGTEMSRSTDRLDGAGSPVSRSTSSLSWKREGDGTTDCGMVLAPSGSIAASDRPAAVVGAPPGSYRGLSGSMERPSSCALLQSSPTPPVRPYSSPASISKPLVSRRLAYTSS